MNRRLCLLLLGFAVALSPTTPAWADGWGIPVWNPFKSKSSERVQTRLDDEQESSGWSFPKLEMPSMSLTSKRKSNEPSTWTKINNGTKEVFNKTVDVLTPWDNDKPATRTAKPRKKKPSLFSSWFSSKEPEPKKIQSVSDFIGQPRPPF